ncbi:MAG: VCBS repeat-containing protein [Phycisphaerales bacterium]|nr:MAG: VCBS repeat-containing protein [Phycisphaerales bacterium]
MLRVTTQRRSPRVVGSMTLISITFLFVSVPEVLGQFCPDAGTVYSTTDQAEGDAPIVVRTCDIDTDGDPDLITANDGSHTVSVLINDGNGTYAAPSRWTTTTTPFEPLCCEEPVDFDCCTEPVNVACCDVNGDTHVDLVTVNHTSDDVSVLLNDGSMQFAAPVRYTVGEAPFGIECLNLDGDIDNDLVTNGFTEDAISVLLNNGDGTFAPHVTYAAGDAPIAMTLCDVDGDGDDDVVTANMLSKDVSVLRNNADGTFTNIGSAGLCTGPTECVNPFDIACCDFDGVNGPDVATANGIVDTVTVLFNDGAGSYGGLASYNNLDGAYGVTCCDLDADADVDVVSANLVSDDLAVFLNDGAGSFGAPSFLTVGTDSTADPSSVICSDPDGDLDTDLITSFIGGVTLFENDCGGSTCGNGVPEEGEACDDGFTDDCGTCNATCTGPGNGSTCGDAELCPETEACDDGFTDVCGSCNATCTGPGTGSTCGDGAVCLETEECDDGGESVTCDLDCTIAECGDGTLNVTAGEECDDGNTIDGDCCSAGCLSEDCPCQAPAVSAAGPRYLAITPQPLASAEPVRLRVTSPDWPCLSKYVGVMECGGDGDVCRTDADCNKCSFTQMPCLTDEDCDYGQCDDGTPCSVSLDNCIVGTCVRAEHCALSGLLCEPAGLAPFDINNDSLPDGTLAALVDDPTTAAALTPSQWSGGVMRCSKTAIPCETNGNADCRRGYCEDTGSVCDHVLQNCYGQGEQCILDEECLPGAVYVYGTDIRPSDYDAMTQTLLPIHYEVHAECTVTIDPVSVTMWKWGDTNNNGYLNVTDIHLLILAIQGHYDYSTLVTDDLAGINPCLPQQILNVSDTQMAVQAVEGWKYRDNNCPEPCP